MRPRTPYLPTLLLVFLACPFLVSSTDIVLSWGTSSVPPQTRNILPVPTRVLVSETPIKFVSHVHQSDLVLLLDNGNILAWGGPDNSFTNNDLLPVLESFGLANRSLDTSRIVSKLPTTTTSVHTPSLVGFSLTSEGKLWWWGSSGPWGSIIKPHPVPSPFPVGQLPVGSDTRFRAIKCSSTECILHGTSGRLYIATLSALADRRRDGTRRVSLFVEWHFPVEIASTELVDEPGASRPMELFDLYGTSANRNGSPTRFRILARNATGHLFGMGDGGNLFDDDKWVHLHRDYPSWNGHWDLMASTHGSALLIDSALNRSQFIWFGSGVADHNLVIQDFIARQMALSDPVVGLAGSFSTYTFLTSSGKLLQFTVDLDHWDEDFPALYLTGSPVPGSVPFVEPLWMDSVIPAVPSTHVVTSIHGSSGTGWSFYAIAKPRLPEYSNVVVTLVDPVSEPLQDRRTVVTYGYPNAKSGVGWARDEYLSGEDNPIRLSPTEASLSHLDPALRNFTKIVTSSRDLIMALTTTGQLLSWGCNNAPGLPYIECSAVSPNFVSNSGYNVYLPIPIPVDAAFYDNKKVLDIAVTSSDGDSSKFSFAVALLEDGSLVWWGEYEALAVYRRDASNVRLIGPQSKYDLATTTFENIPFDRFTSVHASNGLMWATSGNGSIWAWNPASTDMARPTELFPENEFGRIELFDGCGDVLIALVNDSDSGTRRLLSFQRSSIFDCNYFDMSSPSGDLSYCEVQPNAVTIDYSDIRQILVYQNMLILALTDDGIYALGRGPFTLGVNFVEFTQIPFSIAGIESYSEVKKIAFNGVGLIAITLDGRLFSTNIGEYQPNPYGNLYDESERLLLTEVSTPEWIIEDISSDIRAYAGISRHVLARKATSSSTPVQPTPQQAEWNIETVAFGSDATCAYGDGKCRSYPSEVFKFPDNHPINSPTATNIELNLVGSIVDGEINATTPRIIRWGGQSLTSEPAMVRYLGTVYAELPEHWNHTQSSLESIKLVKVVPVGLSHISVFSNCRVDVQWFTADGPTGLSGQSEPARKRSVQSNFPGPGARGDPIKVDDPSYTRTLDRVSYVTDHWNVFWEESLYNTECFNEVTGAQSLSKVEDLQCSIASFELEVGRAPLASHCLLRTTDSLYSFGVFYNFYEPCSMGLFGEVTSCQAAASYYDDEIIPMIRISDNEDSAIYQKKIVQYQLGAQHVVALTSDGSIVAWGDNTYSQLGLGDYASEVPEDGSVTAERRRDVTYRKGTPTKVTVPEYFGSPWRKVIASAYASFALSQDHVLVGWGSNWNGELGRSIPGENVPDYFIPARVNVPLAPIKDVACATSTCYALYERGEIYSWGAPYRGLLGRERTFSSTPDGDPHPAPAIKLKLTDPSKVIESLLTSPTSLTVAVRGRKRPVKPRAPECFGSPPKPEFVCSESKWVYVGNIIVDRSLTPGGAAIVITQPTVVLGNISIPAGQIIEIQLSDAMFDDPNTPILNVTGCFSENAQVRYSIDDQTWKNRRGSTNGRTLLAVESACQMAATGTQIAQEVIIPKDCRRSSASAEGTDRPFSRFGLQSTFTVDSSRCTKWWMILLSVLAAVLIVVAIGVIVWRVYDKKRKVDPRRKASMLK